MSRLPSLKALQAFRYAGESLSFKIAAEQLFVSQAAVSQQIKNLEAQLGLKLFHRKPRAVVLTSQGQQLFTAVSVGFETIEKAIGELTGDHNPGRLNISAMPSFSSRWLVPKLGRFQGEAPELTINLSLSQTLADFGGQNLDAAIRFGPGNYADLRAVKLFEEMLIPVCHPSLLASAGALQGHIETMPLLMDEAPDVLSAWEAFKSESGLQLDLSASRLVVSDANMLVEAVLAGQGLSLLPFGLIHDLLTRKQLVCPLPVWVKSSFDYYLVAPPAHFHRHKVQAFLSWLQQEFAVTEERWRQFQREMLEPSN